jgi:protein-S-isoprenylcysteine O-methyltransferase Ste14
LRAPIDATGAVGIAIGAAGLTLLGLCVWEFAQRGRGTLSPVDPPTYLVVRGPYRHVRNPMYVAVSATLLGQALLVRSFDLVVYWAVFYTVASVFIIAYEEPYLRRHFGVSYDEYAARVRRWIPRLRA